MKDTKVILIERTRPVLFSAPHTKIHRRPTLSMKYKQPEPLTGKIVEELCTSTKSFGIILDSELEYDPNYHKERRNEYKREIRKIVKENKIKYFIDIHGVLDDSGYDIGIFCATRFSKSMKTARLISENIGRKKLLGLNTQILKLPNSMGESISEFVASELRVPAIQIEVAKYIRDDDVLLKSFIANLSDIVNREFV